MTRSSFDTILHEAGHLRSGRAGLARPRLHFGARVTTRFYVEEPDIPEGVTCAEWRRRRQRLAKRGHLAHLSWPRWHPLREALS